MNTLSRRVAAIALGGVLAVGSLSGCGVFGSTLDCGKLNSASQQLIDAGSDNAKMKSALDELEKSAEGVNDEELKQAVKDISTETKKNLKALESEQPDPSQMGDVDKITAASKTITEKCG